MPVTPMIYKQYHCLVNLKRPPIYLNKAVGQVAFGWQLTGFDCERDPSVTPYQWSVKLHLGKIGRTATVVFEDGLVKQYKIFQRMGLLNTIRLAWLILCSKKVEPKQQE